MKKRAWYVIALLLLAGACMPVTEPQFQQYTPSDSVLSGIEPDQGRQPHRKLDP
ncbi:MAG: hypothetical protein ACREMW_03790 [Gemmatimonadales bacterium]